MKENKLTLGIGGFISLTSLLTIIFILLRLSHIIDWAWILVFLPAIIGIGFWLFILFISLMCSVLESD